MFQLNIKMRKIINLPAVVDPSSTSIWIVPTTNEVELLKIITAIVKRALKGGEHTLFGLKENVPLN